MTGAADGYFGAQRTGTQGAQGLQGAQGAQGLQGAQGPQGVLFDLVLSFGHGITADQTLTGGVSFWFTPTTIADFAVANQVREWVTPEALGFVGLDVNVDAASFGEGAGAVVVTVGGLDTALSVPITDGDSGVLQNSALLSIPAGSTVGVRWDPGSVADGSIFRAEIRLRGATTGTPIVPSVLPINAKALFIPEDLAVDGNTWVDSVAGNLYTATVPPPSGPPPPGVDPVEGPARVVDGSFKNNPYAYFRHYTGPLSQVYTPCMLASSVSMFTGADPPPIAPRTVVVVCSPESSIGGIAFVTSRGSHSFTAALSRPTGNPTQAVYWNLLQDSTQTDNLATPENFGGREIVCIWRTDGTTLEFFINGIKQTLDVDTIGQDFAARVGCTIGNLEAEGFSSQDGWQGGICFVGVWARKFSDTEVLSATGNLTSEYVTP
jgi:hypothetical protein